MNLTDKTQKELYSLAKELNIAGRSRMNKSELLTAVEEVKETARTTTANNTDHEKAEAFKLYSLFTKSNVNAERPVIKKVDGVTRYFLLLESSYRYNESTLYSVEISEREFMNKEFENAWPYNDVMIEREKVVSLLLNEILEFIEEIKDVDGQPYMTVDSRLSKEETDGMAVINSGHTDDLLYESQYKRVWRSRMTKEDGDELDHAITIEYNNASSHRWETVDRYEPEPDGRINHLKRINELKK